MNSFAFALMLTIFAGLATGIGSLLSFLAKEFNQNFLLHLLDFLQES